MLRAVAAASSRVLQGIPRAIRAHPKLFVAVVIGVFALDLVLPPLVLSVTRKPWDHFSFNPWIKHVPEWLASDEATTQEKLSFLSRMAVFWFIANGPADEPEWGFTATVSDLARWLFMGVLFGAFFAVWTYRYRQAAACGMGMRLGRPGGSAGVLVSTLGLSTLPCSVVGCGAPVLPVLGLVFTGLSSETLAWLATIPRLVNTVVLLGVTASVLYLGWLAGPSPESGEVVPAPAQAAS